MFFLDLRSPMCCFLVFCGVEPNMCDIIRFCPCSDSMIDWQYCSVFSAVGQRWIIVCYELLPFSLPRFGVYSSPYVQLSILLNAYQLSILLGFLLTFTVCTLNKLYYPAVKNNIVTSLRCQNSVINLWPSTTSKLIWNNEFYLWMIK